MLIYRKNDKVTVEIDGIEIKVSPLTFGQKSELQGHMMKAVDGEMDEAMTSVRKSMKYCIKEIKGIEYLDEDGEKHEYQLQFEDGQLTDDCIDELLNLPISAKLSTVCSNMLQGVPDKILDDSGNEIEGIKVKKPGEPKPGKQGKKTKKKTR